MSLLQTVLGSDEIDIILTILRETRMDRFFRFAMTCRWARDTVYAIVHGCKFFKSLQLYVMYQGPLCDALAITPLEARQVPHDTIARGTEGTQDPMYQFNVLEAVPALAKTLGGWDKLRLRLNIVDQRRAARRNLREKRIEVYKQRRAKLDAWILKERPLGPNIESVEQWVRSFHTRFPNDFFLPRVFPMDGDIGFRVDFDIGVFTKYLNFEAPLNIETKVTFESAKEGILAFEARIVARNMRKREVECVLEDDYGLKILDVIGPVYYEYNRHSREWKFRYHHPDLAPLGLAHAREIAQRLHNCYERRMRYIGRCFAINVLSNAIGAVQKEEQKAEKKRQREEAKAAQLEAKKAAKKAGMGV